MRREQEKVNFAESGIVVCRTELPSAVREEAGAWDEDCGEVLFEGFDESSKFSVLFECGFHAPDFWKDKALDRRDNSRIGVFPHRGRNVVIL